MELLDQIRRISFLFFFVIGLVHFISGLMYVNGYGASTAGLINRVLFIPFVVSSLTYAFSNFKYQLMEHGPVSKMWNYSMITIGIIIFLSLLAIELFVADSATPLAPSL